MQQTLYTHAHTHTLSACTTVPRFITNRSSVPYARTISTWMTLRWWARVGLLQALKRWWVTPHHTRPWPHANQGPRPKASSPKRPTHLPVLAEELDQLVGAGVLGQPRHADGVVVDRDRGAVSLRVGFGVTHGVGVGCGACWCSPLLSRWHPLWPPWSHPPNPLPTCAHSRLLTKTSANVTRKKVAAPRASRIDIATTTARLLKGRLAGGRRASERNASVIWGRGGGRSGPAAVRWLWCICYEQSALNAPAPALQRPPPNPCLSLSNQPVAATTHVALPLKQRVRHDHARCPVVVVRLWHAPVVPKRRHRQPSIFCRVVPFEMVVVWVGGGLVGA